MDTRYLAHLMSQARRSRQQQIDRLLWGDIVLEMDTSYQQSDGKLPALAEGKLPALRDIKVKHYE